MSMKKNDVNPLTVDEDFFIEKKEPSGTNLAYSQTTEDEDIDYYLRNLYRSLKIPKEYINSSSYLNDNVDRKTP